MRQVMLGICVAVNPTTSMSSRCFRATLKLWKSLPAAPMIKTLRALMTSPQATESTNPGSRGDPAQDLGESALQDSEGRADLRLGHDEGWDEPDHVAVRPAADQDQPLLLAYLPDRVDRLGIRLPRLRVLHNLDPEHQSDTRDVPDARVLGGHLWELARRNAPQDGCVFKELSRANHVNRRPRRGAGHGVPSERRAGAPRGPLPHEFPPGGHRRERE